MIIRAVDVYAFSFIPVTLTLYFRGINLPLFQRGVVTCIPSSRDVSLYDARKGYFGS